MEKRDFKTLSEAVNTLSAEGFTDGFKTEDNKIVGTMSSTEYKPDDLKIVGTFRFEGMTNPGDDTALFAITANDGNKGTLVMSHSAEHNHDVELIKQIPQA